MHTQLGLVHFWQQGDVVTHATAILLLLLSVGSWALIVGRFARQLRINLACDRAPEAFWQARKLGDALAAIEAADRTGIFSAMARAAAHAHHGYDSTACLGAGVSLSEGLTRSLRKQMLAAQASLETGLTFLASVGSTAPFIGLFGTVWGIYHALIALSGSTSVVLDKVAGPVGEALIMTAAGLFVAIPAVLAYNALTRANRLVMAQLDGFAHDLHAYFTTGARRPASADFSADPAAAAPALARQAA
ncbi:MAG: MotA/TolQ/ExbB proton channel family protein [Rhodocyclales bacterium]|nr:MotA/TolQ/ExbB proton channel family protein [Rhodocyclales bacterium]